MCQRNCCHAGQHVNSPLARLHFQIHDWPDDHLMEPPSNEDTHLHSPVPDAQTDNTLPLHCDDQHFSSPSTPPPTYGEAGKKTKSLAAITRENNVCFWLHHCYFAQLSQYALRNISDNQLEREHQILSSFLLTAITLNEATVNLNKDFDKGKGRTKRSFKTLFSFSNSCQCSPARSLPCPDTTQCATRSLCGSGPSTHTELDRTAILRGGQTPPISIGCTNVQQRSAHPQWRCLLHNSSTHLWRCRLESRVASFSLAQNQVEVSNWRRKCLYREEQLGTWLYTFVHHIQVHQSDFVC